MNRGKNRRFVPATIVAVFVATLVMTASPGFAASPGDSVRGRGVVSSSTSASTLKINARSEANGANPTGTLSVESEGGFADAIVTCLNVNGATALVGVEVTESSYLTPGSLFVIRFIDGSPDTFRSSGASADDCTAPFTAEGAFPYTKGGIRVTDN